MDLAGKYRLIAELGQGGMATVYLAVALGTSGFRKLAVVKLIRPQYASDPDLIQMFLDEARLCARLNHPNIVQTYDVGIEDGQYLMAMEYLDGVSLHTAVSRLAKSGTAFPPPMRARVLLEVLEGLRYAHGLTDYDGKRLDIVHRDVTPHNIFITYDGQVKLLDFGIAKAATSSVQTATGVIKGKLTYMAPEQALCEGIDARADLYAVGVMLWEAVTGRRRWPAGLSDAAVFTRVASGDLPEPPNAEAAGLPADLDDVVLRSLAPRREDRFQSAGEMRAALEPILQRIDAGSLRDLGAMLSVAFADDRRRIRQIIEDQFRMMDSGSILAAAAALPTMHPPRGTDSALHERLPTEFAPVPSPPATEDLLTFSDASRKTGSGITGLTRGGDAQPALPPSRSRIILAAAGLLAVAALAGAAAGMISRSTMRPADTRPAAQVLAPPPQSATAGAAGPVAPGQPSVASSLSHMPSSGILQASSADTRPSEPAGRTGIASQAPSASSLANRREPARGSSPSPRAQASAAVEAPTASAAPSPSEIASPFRVPSSKPKVNLERDNPWP